MTRLKQITGGGLIKSVGRHEKNLLKLLVKPGLDTVPTKMQLKLLFHLFSKLLSGFSVPQWKLISWYPSCDVRIYINK